MVGVSTYCLLHKPLPDALDELATITGLIEVMDEGPHAITDPDLFASYSCDFMLHAPYHGINIASLHEPIRRASVEVMTDCLAVAAAIGAGVVMHPGYFAWPQEREPADRQFKKSLGGIRAAAADRGVRFSFENMGNMNYFNLRAPDDLALIDGCGFTLDCGHANVNGCLPGFLEKEFSHMHLHDNDGRRDSHSPVGDGSIDFAPVVAALRRNQATAVVEVKSLAGVRSSLKALERV